MTDLQRRIAYAERQFQIAQQYAAYWAAQATTGACQSRHLSHGDGTPFTPQQKVEESLMTMVSHIHNMSDISDQIFALQEQLAQQER